MEDLIKDFSFDWAFCNWDRQSDKHTNTNTNTITASVIAGQLIYIYIYMFVGKLLTCLSLIADKSVFSNVVIRENSDIIMSTKWLMTYLQIKEKSNRSCRWEFSFPSKKKKDERSHWKSYFTFVSSYITVSWFVCVRSYSIINDDRLRPTAI